MHRVGEIIPLSFAMWDAVNEELKSGQNADLKVDIIDESDTTVASYFLGDAQISEYFNLGVYYVNANDFADPGLYKIVWVCQVTDCKSYLVDLIKIHARDIDNVDGRLANDSTGLGTLENKINNVQAELNDPTQFMADVSALATQASIDNVAGQLLDTTGLNVIRLAAEDDSDLSSLATQASIDNIAGQLLDDSTGLHALKTFLQDLHYFSFNKVVLTRISATSYRMEVYDPAGASIVRTINLTKAGAVETRE